MASGQWAMAVDSNATRRHPPPPPPGENVSIQWVPSHVVVVGHEQADQQAAKGAKISLQQVIVHKTVTGIWAELGLEEMPDE